MGKRRPMLLGAWVLAALVGVSLPAGGAAGAEEGPCTEPYLHDCGCCGRLEPHYPSYVALGKVPSPPQYADQTDHEAEVSFRISVRMRPGGPLPLVFAYTQDAFIIASCCSAPLREQVYWPELYLDYERNPAGMAPGEIDGWGFRGGRVGIDHQSNGRDNESGLSRAWTRLFVELKFADGKLVPPAGLDYTQPLERATNLRRPEPEFVTLRWRFWLTHRDNPADVDLADALGNTQLALQVTTAAQQLTIQVRRGSLPDTFTTRVAYAVAAPRMLQAGVMFLVQYFNGVGETLLDTEQRHTGWRAGLMLTR
jgi:outer membrane phospholipase A